MNIIVKIKYSLLSTIHKFPAGITNRFQKTADKWVQSLNHSNVKTYHQFFLNQQTNKYQVKLYRTQNQQLHLKQVSQKFRPGIARLADFIQIFHPQRVDDYEPSRNIQDMTLLKFFKEAVKEKQQFHKYPFYLISLVTLNLICYFIFIHGHGIPQNQRVKVLNAQILQTYQFDTQQKFLKEIKDKIAFIHQEYVNQLQKAKEITKK